MISRAVLPDEVYAGEEGVEVTAEGKAVDGDGGERGGTAGGGKNWEELKDELRVA